MSNVGPEKNEIFHAVKKQITAFMEPRYKHPANREVNVFNSSLLIWSRYCKFLEIILARYNEKCVPHVKAIKMQMERATEKAKKEPGPRPVTAEELAESKQQGEISDILHLDIESFYLFASILLDRIASTFKYYFSRDAKLDHKNFKKVMIRISQEKGWATIPAEIIKMQADLQDKVCKYRNRLITHAGEPNLMHVTMWDGNNKIRIYSTFLFPEDEEAKTKQVPSGDLDEMIVLIGKYIIAIIDFFEANAGDSILPPQGLNPVAGNPELTN